MYTVTKEDCIGKLEGFPVEVVQQMLKEQVAQGNECNVKVFQDSIRTVRSTGGFNWRYTKEGYNFWEEVIVRKDFKLFFTAFPQFITYKVGDVLRIDRLLSWSSEIENKTPLNVLDSGDIITVVEVAKPEEEHTSFAATHNGVRYGFSFNKRNKYTLVGEFCGENTAKEKVTEELNNSNTDCVFTLKKHKPDNKIKLLKLKL